MKKLLALMLTTIFITGFFMPATALAATYDWTDGYYDYLLESVASVKQGTNNLSKFALYDMNNDGLPELILKNTKLDGSYQIYNYAGSQVKLERNLSASTFYVTKDNKLVVAYGDVAGTTYVYYDSDKSIATSEIMFRSRRGAQDSSGEWQWVYFFGNKEVSKDKFEQLMSSELSNIGMVFSDITEGNLRSELLMGLGFPGYSQKAYFSGDRNIAGTNVTLSFANGVSAPAVKNGENLIYGLLLVNGVFVNNSFPVNINGSTLVPVRAVSENLNASVAWVGDLQKIIVEKGSKSIEMYIDEYYALVDGQRVNLDIAPTLINGSTYVPLRFVSENLDTDVKFTGGDGNFLPIISIESKSSKSYNEFDEYAAISKAKFLMKGLNWTADNNVFSRSYMDNNVSIKSEGLVLGRYWSVTIDLKETQRLLFDKFTGHVYSKYTYDSEFGIVPGIDAAIDAMIATYTY